MLGEPLRAQKKHASHLWCGVFFFVALVGLCASRKAEPFFSQNALAQAHLLQAVEIKFRSLYKLK
jgi:hypothetical protein